MKKAGPEPIQATEPLLIVGQTSMGISLNVVPCASTVPCINPKGGPKAAWNEEDSIASLGRIIA